MTSIDLGIPGYHDVSELNRGGFATIYRAWQPTFEREVAIKVLSGQADDAAAERFRRECAAVGALVRPSEHRDRLRGRRRPTTGASSSSWSSSTADRWPTSCPSRGTFDMAEVLDYGGRIAGAIESAHRAGILHRDLKPENILLSRLGEPKVADFGHGPAPGRSPSVTGRDDRDDRPRRPRGPGGRAAHRRLRRVLAGVHPVLPAVGPPPVRRLRRSRAWWRWSAASRARSPPTCGPRRARGACAGCSSRGWPRPRPTASTTWPSSVASSRPCRPPSDQPITRLPDRLGRAAAGGVAAGRGTPTPRPRRTRPPHPHRGRGRPRRRGRRVGRHSRSRPDRASPLPVLYQDNFDAGQNWYEHDDESPGWPTTRTATGSWSRRRTRSSSPTPPSAAASTASP